MLAQPGSSTGADVFPDPVMVSMITPRAGAGSRSAAPSRAAAALDHALSITPFMSLPRAREWNRRRIAACQTGRTSDISLGSMSPVCEELMSTAETVRKPVQSQDIRGARSRVEARQAARRGAARGCPPTRWLCPTALCRTRMERDHGGDLQALRRPSPQPAVGSVMQAMSRLSPPQAGHASGTSSAIRAMSLAQAMREVSRERGSAFGAPSPRPSRPRGAVRRQDSGFRCEAVARS
jgi:hypothetical protein